LKWTGDFENQQRATKRLAQVVPVSIAIIFVILFVLFGNARDAGLVLLNVPYAAVGGILALLITSFNFSISAGIGFIALFGICIQNGVIMISDIKNNLRERHPLEDSIKMSVKSRVRSVLMTASMAAIGLLPAALSRYRIGKPASLGDRDHWRINRGHVLHPLCLSVDGGGFLSTNAL
jgi:cobalt-zinc-cadmium resistance protein CzcA